MFWQGNAVVSTDQPDAGAVEWNGLKRGGASVMRDRPRSLSLIYRSTTGTDINWYWYLSDGHHPIFMKRVGNFGSLFRVLIFRCTTSLAASGMARRRAHGRYEMNEPMNGWRMPTRPSLTDHLHNGQPAAGSLSRLLRSLFTCWFPRCFSAAVGPTSRPPLPSTSSSFISFSLSLSFCLSVCLPVRLSMFSFLISSVHPHKFPALAHKEPAEFPTILVCLIELLNERGVDRNDSCFLISLSSVLAYAPTDIDTNPWLGCKSTDTFQSNSLDHCGARAKTNIRFICYQSRYEFIENHQFIYSNHLDQIQASVVSN